YRSASHLTCLPPPPRRSSDLAPPLTRWADGLALAAECDGALVVIEMDETRHDSLLFLRDALARNRTPILGSVLNRSGRYWPRSRSEEHTSELQSRENLVCRLL